MNRSQNEINALITLLDDPDGSVHSPVMHRLEELGEVVIKPLEKTWEMALSVRLQERIENVIRQIQYNQIRLEMSRWIESGGDQLLYVAALFARVQYPELEYDSLNRKIEEIKAKVWLELNEQLTALEKVKVLNYFLYTIHRFNRSSKGVNMPYLFFINHVLDTRKGSPVILGIIYAVIAQRLGFPILGVNLPRNFVLCYHDPAYLDDPDGILFYINPYNQGSVLGRKELEHFLKEQKIEPAPEHLKPCNNFEIAIRLAENLDYAYRFTHQEEKSLFIRELLLMLKEGALRHTI